MKKTKLKKTPEEIIEDELKPMELKGEYMKSDADDYLDLDFDNIKIPGQASLTISGDESFILDILQKIGKTNQKMGFKK